MLIPSSTVHVTQDTAAAVDRLGDEIAELSAHLEAATACLLDLIREFDARGGWNTGFRSCAAWLSWRVGLDLGAARERVWVARALGSLPLLAGAFARGELSYSKVRALTRVATPETEARLLAVGRAGTAYHVERIVRGWRRVDQLAESREAARQHRSRALHVYPDADGMVVIRGRLTPEVGSLLQRAREAAGEVLYQRSRRVAPAAEPSAEPPSRAQRQADALGLIAETALHHELDPARRAVPGGRARGRRSAGRPRPTRPIPAGRGRPRSRGNFPAPRVRCEPGGDAARRGRADRGGRRPDAHDSAGVAARSAAS